MTILVCLIIAYFLIGCVFAFVDIAYDLVNSSKIEKYWDEYFKEETGLEFDKIVFKFEKGSIIKTLAYIFVWPYYMFIIVHGYMTIIISKEFSKILTENL